MTNDPIRGSFYRVFFERSFDPMALYDVGDRQDFRFEKVRFLDVNRAYERVMGVAREQVLGKTFRHIWPDTEPRWEGVISDCVRTGHSARAEGWSELPGVYLEALSMAVPPGRVAVIFFDKTAWKQKDDELKRSQQELLANRAKLRELAARFTLSEEKTRRNIATDLHDRFGYSLVMLLHKLRGLESRRLSPALRSSLTEAQQELEKLIDESRSLVFKLSPPVLLDVGLNPALEMLADQMLTPLGISWSIQGQDSAIFDQPADDAVCVLLYRMTRELLLNVVRHARAHNVTIGIHRGTGKIQVVVEDDGQGFSGELPDGPDQSGSFGLFSIQERLITIGGSLRVISSPGQGTTVSMTAPRRLTASEVLP